MVAVVPLIISVGLMLLSRLLLKPKKTGEKDGLGEDQPNNYATRGTVVPTIYGKRRVGASVVWVGDRKTKKESVGGGGKKGGGGGGSIKQVVYYESRCDVIAVGPLGSLHMIFKAGKKLWEGPIDSENSPSGTSIDLGKNGAFTIYWGEVDQPINEFLGASTRIGIKSRWPLWAYIVWEKVRLGPSPQWPQIEYVITGGCADGSPLSDSEFNITAGSAEGVNGAHVIYTLLTAPWPHGVGDQLDKDEVDWTGIEAFGLLVEDEGLPMNIEMGKGDPVSNTISLILTDCGVSMPQVGNKLQFIPIRKETEDVVVLSDDLVVPASVEREIDRGERSINRPVFYIKDETGGTYRQLDYKFDDDAALSAGGVRPQTIEISTITSPSVGARVANRRCQEALATSGVSLEVLRGARLLVPGQAFDYDGVRYRVTGKSLSDESPAAKIDGIVDIYGIPGINDDWVPPDFGGPLSAQPDIIFTFLEIPPELSRVTAIGVLRARKHEQIAGAFIYASANGAAYTQIGNQDAACAAGVLEASIAASGTGDIIAAGPVFEPYNDEIESALDLSSDTPSWQQGRQIMVINNEIFFVQSVTMQDQPVWQESHAYSLGQYVKPSVGNGFRYKCTTAGTSNADQPDWPTETGLTVTDGSVVWECHRFGYTANNMIRARYGTAMALHNAGDVCFLADTEQIEALTATILTPGAGICIKTSPFTSSDEVDISGVSPVCKTLTGAATGSPFLADGTGDLFITSLGENLVYVD